jgi:hypothetical protein
MEREHAMLAEYENQIKSAKVAVQVAAVQQLTSEAQTLKHELGAAASMALKAQEGRDTAEAKVYNLK